MTATMEEKTYCAVLTGATGGIGRAIAAELVHRCRWLILVGRNLAALQAMQAELGAHAIHIVHGDLLQEETLSKIETLARGLGGINLLVNNAGASEFHAFESQRNEQIAQLLQTNLLAPMLLSRQLIPLLRTSPRAQIVNIGSVFGSIGFPGFAAYCASKSGLRGFSQALRRELLDSRIEVRYFAPRATATPINSAAVQAMNMELKTAEDSPAHVARQLMHFLKDSRWERTLGLKESFFILLNKLAPALPDKAILGQLPIIRKYLPK